MPFDRIGLEKTPAGKFVIVFLDTQLRRPFMQTSIPLSREEAGMELRELDLPEVEIRQMLVEADSALV
ncbi:MAG TPA: hypothetical protein VMT32_18755 [Bryobacteraceae bacterium]|nr:hypothetical protein [Bryobacteraceae bacterium]